MSPHFLEYATLVLAVAGLATVLSEIWLKEPALLGQILRNARNVAAPKGRLRGDNVAFSHQTRGFSA
ncbi:hypothetical protein [Methylobrevis pamukkalensis]|uniref:Uncharacterized protein n=1 Tax=Methylobrevis pamukkalensis TaxID=1439726 RepID=A0A1E3GS75_9HYPH|nr:hypothetical protein [Methylobrevis pamukkalensis]ODN66918.1 hypothetical protein A6302_04419 [Methylobrevis pamukkalensis]